MWQVPRARGPTVAVLGSTGTYQPRYHGLARDGPAPGYHSTFTFSTFSGLSSSLSPICRVVPSDFTSCVPSGRQQRQPAGRNVWERK